MKIKVTSIFVEDQEKALKFYTDVLGFVKKTDMPAGDYKWITVVSPEEPGSVELLLEPNNNPAAETYQKAIYDEGVPTISFTVDDIQQEYERLKKRGVEFTAKPTEVGPVTFAIFDDTCGNLIQISQEK